MSEMEGKDFGAKGTASMPEGLDLGVYAISFGNYPNKMAYQKPVYTTGLDAKDRAEMEVDLRPELKDALDRGMALSAGIDVKALSVVGMGAGTAGKDLIPVSVDPRLVDLSRRFTPWTEMFQRVTNFGITADYNRITAKGGGFTAGDDAALAEKNNTYSRASKNIRQLYAVGRVTGLAQAAVPSYILQGLQPTGTGTDTIGFGSPTAPNALQMEVLVQGQALQELEENLIWNGNETASAISGNPNGTEFDGIITQQGSTNINNLAGDDVVWDDIEETGQLAFDDSGHVTAAGSNSRTAVDIRKIMLDFFRMSPGQLGGTTGFGIPARLILELMQGPVPLIPSQFLTNTVDQGQLWLMDMEFAEMRVLLDSTFQRMGVNNDSNKFFLKKYECFLLRGIQFNAFIDNID